MKPTPVICSYDADNDPVICSNRKYMSRKYLSPTQKCNGCSNEVQDLFHGTDGWETWQWYCNFNKEG